VRFEPGSFWSTLVPGLLAMALATAVFVSNEWSSRAAMQSQASLAERSRVRTITETVLRRLVDAESAQRGYLLTGRPEYLEPYRNADADVLRGLAEIGQHFGGDADSRAAYDELTRHARHRLSELATTIAMYDAGDHLGWKGVLVSGQGRATMTAARNSAQALLDGENRRIEAAQAVVADVLERGRLAVHITTLLALIWLIFFLGKNRALQRTQAAHAQDLRQQRDALEQQVAARTEELRELNAHLQDVREVERAKLARLLHDDLGALLTAAKLDLARLRRALPEVSADVGLRLQHLGSTIDQGVALKRHVIEELSPSALHNLGLRAALEILVSEFRQRHCVSVTLDIEDVALPESPRIAVYRLVQECLENLQRHAAMAAARVIVRRTESQLLIQVSDSGPGFDPTRVPPSSHGLRKLRHRIEALGGRLFVISAPGRGTEVEARLPLPTTA
jgi:signal transduction histidine kinase